MRGSFTLADPERFTDNFLARPLWFDAERRAGPPAKRTSPPTPWMPINVAFFVSCLTDQYYPRVGVATVKVLQHFGCGVTFPMGQTCCGQPLLHAGLEPEARAVARRFVELFETAEYVVTPSPACAAMVRERYPKLLADDAAYETGMWHVAGRTYELVEFLTTIVRADLTDLKLPTPVTAAYHPACPLRTLAVTDDAPRVLRQLGVKARPVPSADVCCGFGGPFAERYPSISRTMADAKARSIASTGAQMTVCNEAGCAMTIANAAGRAGTAERVVHIAELIAEAMGLNTERF